MGCDVAQGYDLSRLRRVCRAAMARDCLVSLSRDDHNRGPVVRSSMFSDIRVAGRYYVQGTAHHPGSPDGPSM